MRLRYANLADADLLFQLATDPVVRAASLTPEPPTWAEHHAWFLDRLRDPYALLFIGVEKAVGVGAVRFQRVGMEVTVSVAVHADWRGQGYGDALVRQGTDRMATAWPDVTAHARIKRGNAASLAAFLAAGYAIEEEGELLRLTWRPRADR